MAATEGDHERSISIILRKKGDCEQSINVIIDSYTTTSEIPTLSYT